MSLFNVAPPAFDLDETCQGYETLLEKHRVDDKKQVQCLLDNPNFRLIKVERCEAQIDEHRKEIKSLTVVTPAVDSSIAEDVRLWGWYSLSHMWGPPAEWIEWNDSGVVDGVTGNLIKVKVHPEKPKTIMDLLQIQYISYWWIDIFCAQSDTPLVIMGDIYKHCSSCNTLTDGPYQVGQDEVFKPLSNAAILSEQYLEEAAYGYLGIINTVTYDEEEEAVPVNWSKILKDVLYWASTHLEMGVDGQLNDWNSCYVRGTNAANFFDALMPLSLDEKIAFAEKFFASDKYQPWNFRCTDATCMLTLRSYKSEYLVKAQRVFADFLDCQWMNRVWTLQEFALPHCKAVTPPGSGSCDFRMWLPIFSALSKVIERAHDIRAAEVMAVETEQIQGVRSARQILDFYRTADPVLARIYSDYRKVLEMAITVGYSPEYNTMDESQEILRSKTMLSSFGTSQRRALYPADYVYGVLGILDIDVPRLDDLKEIWEIFSTKLRERYPDILIPDDVDLAEAKKMEDVYGGFGFPCEKTVSSDVIDYIMSLSNIY